MAKTEKACITLQDKAITGEIYNGKFHVVNYPKNKIRTALPAYMCAEEKTTVIGIGYLINCVIEKTKSTLKKYAVIFDSNISAEISLEKNGMAITLVFFANGKDTEISITHEKIATAKISVIAEITKISAIILHAEKQIAAVK